jgi:dTDP-4-amino-4,6-dideoxygalactose transaminase
MDHTFMMYPIFVKTDTFSRKELTQFLEERNIETRPMFPLLNQPVYKKLFGDLEKNYPVSKKIYDKGFYIGCHHGLDETDLDYIIETFTLFLNKR